MSAKRDISDLRSYNVLKASNFLKLVGIAKKRSYLQPYHDYLMTYVQFSKFLLTKICIANRPSSCPTLNASYYSSDIKLLILVTHNKSLV